MYHWKDTHRFNKSLTETRVVHLITGFLLITVLLLITVVLLIIVRLESRRVRMGRGNGDNGGLTVITRRVLRLPLDRLGGVGATSSSLSPLSSCAEGSGVDQSLGDRYRSYDQHVPPCICWAEVGHRHPANTIDLSRHTDPGRAFPGRHSQNYSRSRL